MGVFTGNGGASSVWTWRVSRPADVLALSVGMAARSYSTISDKPRAVWLRFPGTIPQPQYSHNAPIGSRAAKLTSAANHVPQNDLRPSRERRVIVEARGIEPRQPRASRVANRR